MGYYTNYSLEIANEDFGEYLPESDLNAIRDKFNEIFKANYDAFADIYYEDSNTAEWKWYSHKEDMIQLAKAFPKFYFTLCGEGEEREDVWIEQYHGDEFYKDTAELIEPKRKW